MTKAQVAVLQSPLKDNNLPLSDRERESRRDRWKNREEQGRQSTESELVRVF